jgi:hypothetical protein
MSQSLATPLLLSPEPALLSPEPSRPLRLTPEPHDATEDSAPGARLDPTPPALDEHEASEEEPREEARSQELQAPRPEIRSRQQEEAEESEEEPSGAVERLLRAPQRFLEDLEGADLVPLTRTLLATVALGAGVFGAVVGAHRGGVQIAYAALKVPALLLGTMAISMPAFIALARALRVRMEAREVVTLSLGACARFALVLAGLAPVLWLLTGWLGYHGTALAVAVACGLAGLSASGLLFQGLSRRGGGLAAGMAFIAVFGVVGAQTSWLLRPFLVRPRTTHVPFVRAIEGDLLDAVWRSGRSAAGVYEEREGE